MPGLSRIVLVRHGQTEGNSRERFHGKNDVALSDEGAAQMRAARHALPALVPELVVASPLQRAWASAKILAPGAPVHLEDDFREIDFGRWEGLTLGEIEASDPPLYRSWRAGAPGFDFPDGERRADFRSRVARGLARWRGSGTPSALFVAHKGVIRTIVEELCGEPPEDKTIPELGEVLHVVRRVDGRWVQRRRSGHPRAQVFP